MKSGIVAAFAGLMMMRSVLAITLPVANEAELLNALTAVGPGDAILLTADIALSADLPPATAQFSLSSDGARKEIFCSGHSGIKGSVTVDNVAFSTCATAIESQDAGPVVVTNSDLSFCVGPEAAIVVFNHDLTVTGCSFDLNTATNEAAAIDWIGGMTAELLIEDCDFNGNAGGAHGGAVRATGFGSATIAYSTFSGNSADVGGAVFVSVPTVVVECEFDSNTAQQTGGAIHTCKSTAVADSSFTNNLAGQMGGAIHVSPAGSLFLFSGLIQGNTGTTSAGAISSSGGDVSISEPAVITGNAPTNVDAPGAADDCGVCDFGVCNFSGQVADNCQCWPGFVRDNGLCIIGNPDAPSLCDTAVFDPTADPNPQGVVYSLDGAVAARNSFWDSEWTVLQLNSSLPATLTWSAGSSVAEIAAELADTTRNAVCSLSYTCANVSAPAADGSYSLDSCSGSLTCPHSTAAFGSTLTLDAKQDPSGAEATLIQKTPTEWELSAWICYTTGTYRGEPIVACGDITVTPHCF